MAEFTAKDVAKLREMTGVGMNKCKDALVEAQGNLDAAVDLLRKSGAANAVKKASRDAHEGVIAQFIAPGGCWMTKVFAVQFHATDQPMVQPWPEPMMPRSIRSMPLCGTLQLSRSSPVPQRMCGWM